MPGTYAWVARERMRQVPLKKVVDLHAHWVYLQCMQNMWSQFRSQCYQLTLTDSKTDSNQPQHYDYYGATKFSFVLQI